MNHKETDLAAKDVVEAEKKDELPSQKRRERPEKVEPEIENLRKELEGIDQIDLKIRHVIAFMRSKLSGEKEAQLGLLWKGRSFCMTLFKENMSQATRSVLWTEYLELIQEARRVKEILDEASSFAVEQIEIAIKSLEENLQNLPALLTESKEISLPSFADKECLSHRDLYLLIQKELTLLNSFASRVQTLRKEVIRTGMRLKIKNRFFVRLSGCGDLIFPKRREMIKTLSKAFCEDVERFIDSCFKAKTKEMPNYVLREEIKCFQELAKLLSLNTSAFSKTRKELSLAWDTIKEQDQERKKEFAKRRESFKENFEKMMEKITPFAKKCAEESADLKELEKESQEILSEMLSIELTRDDVHRLKEEIKKAQSPFFEKEKALAEEKKRQKREEEEKRKEGINTFLKALSTLVQKSGSMSYDEINQEKARLTQVATELLFNAAEEREMKASLLLLVPILSQKYEESVFSKEGEPQFLDELKALLQQRQGERQKSKKQFEKYRKEVGGSGLDFLQGLQLRDRMEEEKKRLELIDISIEKIEDSIDKLA